ncbi:MAG TPA: DUF4252 domain-containing protein [Pyrinomonadaceae bacterium]|nr:DUF4252 domain-containing protein [Pyrinomonadaceae bacterium]
MKLLTRALACAALTLFLFPPAAADGQGAGTQRPAGLDKYEAEASDSVEVTIDERVLRMAAGALSDRKPEERAVKALVAGLKGVYVRAFEFDREGVYQAAEVEALRARFNGPEWSRVVGVRSRKYGDNVDVFLSGSGEQLKGLAVVIAAPRQLVYVNVSGVIDLERLRDLEGHFSVPRLELYREGKE